MLQLTGCLDRMGKTHFSSKHSSIRACGHFLRVTAEDDSPFTAPLHKYTESTPFFLSDHFPSLLQGLGGGKGRLMPRIIDDVDVDAVADPAKSFLLSNRD